MASTGSPIHNLSDRRLSSEEIRQDFFAFFQERDHELVPSASIVPENDPTLLFTNAGMNQFKDVFLGTGSRPYDRAVDTQKCLRVSGKHNDLEEVGHDTFHHTFFEMLGNWSFGDYFKQEVIRWAWQLLTETWKINPDRLYATVHTGDDTLDLGADEEAAEYWRSETDIDPDHILYCSSTENFWMMGDTGPCGPCSEVHVDLRPEAERKKVPGRELVNADRDDVLEIWNLVFIQYNALADGSLEQLPDQHVDTGMGFERIVAVLQEGSGSTYDTDLFAPLLATIAELSPYDHIKGYDEIEDVSDDERERIRIAMRVVSDHIRAIAFSIADGVTPGNEGRGYVIRRILRRAVRYGYTALGFDEPFLYKLLDPLDEKMAETFPELTRHGDYIRQVVQSEEENFLETLESGLAFFERITPYIHHLQSADWSGDKAREELAADNKTRDLLRKAYVDTEPDDVIPKFISTVQDNHLPGEIAFLLHDTYGFPIDLTRLMAREEDIDVDMERYEELMKRQRERARAASSFSVDQSRTDSWQEVSAGDHSEFVGYDQVEVADARIRAVRIVELEGSQQAQVILDRTPFYAESGGQVADTGLLRVEDDEVEVRDTQRRDQAIVHTVDHLPDELDGPVTAQVDVERRERIKKHHTATHLLHAALREQLGTHVKQKGSLVAPDRLRFDFSHFDRVSQEELRALEHRINEYIQRNVSKHEDRDVPLEEALDRGAMALFGEKYGDRVRVITFDPDFSVELCGGTHVDATGELGIFKFISEGSVASGIRRVEAVSGEAALQYLDRELDTLNQARSRLKGQEKSIDAAIEELQERQSELENELHQLRQKAKASQLDDIARQALQVDSIRLATGTIDGADSDMLQELGEMLRTKMGDGAVGVLGSPDPDEGKVYLVVSVSDDLVAEKDMNAGDLAGQIARHVGGGGGGRPTLATAGGREPGKLEEALEAAQNLVRQQLNG